MSLFGSIGRLARGAVHMASAIEHVPVLGSVVKALPVVGTALSVADIGMSAMNAFGGSSGGGGLPALPTGGAGLPALPGGGAPAIVGKRSIFRNDANVPDAMKAFTISKGDLKQYYRSPMKGYVIRHDNAGDPFAIPKKFARAYYGWRPAKKPPISVGDYESLKRAHRTIKKVKKIHGLIQEVHTHVNAHGAVKIPAHHKKGGHK